MLYRTRYSRQLLLQVVVEHLTGIHSTFTEKERASRVFGHVAQLADKHIIADFFFRCFLQPSQIRTGREMGSSQILFKSPSLLVRDPSSGHLAFSSEQSNRTPSFDDQKANMANLFMPEISDGNLAQNVCIAVSATDLDVKNSFTIIDMESDESIINSSFGIVLAIKRLIQVRINSFNSCCFDGACVDLSLIFRFLS